MAPDLAWSSGHGQGDSVKLRQVLINLLGNAVKFTETGQVSLSVEAAGPERGRFTVSDTGPGIPPEKLDAVFEPFRQEEEDIRHGGTGLGLAITKAYVELMGGVLAVSSVVGEGSTFFFELELPHGTEEDAPDEAAALSRVRRLTPGTTVCALVVDDATNREILSSMLNSIGVETSQAESGQQALGMIVDRTPDIVLTDIRMPDMDGQQLMERLHQSYDSMKIVAVTASVFDRDRQTYLDAGFDDFLDKPVRTELLYACLARQLRVEYDLVEPGESDGDAWRTAPLTSELLSAFDEALRQRSATMLHAAFKQTSAQSPALADHLEPMLRLYDMDGIRDALAQIEKT